MLSVLQLYIRQVMGMGGVVFTSNTTPVTGNFRVIEVIEQANFSALTVENATGSATGWNFPAGTKIYGKITAYTLASGKVAAYKA